MLSGPWCGVSFLFRRAHEEVWSEVQLSTADALFLVFRRHFRSTSQQLMNLPRRSQL